MASVTPVLAVPLLAVTVLDETGHSGQSGPTSRSNARSVAGVQMFIMIQAPKRQQPRYTRGEHLQSA